MTPNLPVELQLHILELALPPRTDNVSQRAELLKRLSLVCLVWTAWAQHELLQQLTIEPRTERRGQHGQKEATLRVAHRIQLASKHGKPLQKLVVLSGPQGAKRMATNYLAMVPQRCADLQGGQ
ncbi:hypothetical protein JCM10213v2_008203 [Rhodosporidiobolus nylandii]